MKSSFYRLSYRQNFKFFQKKTGAAMRPLAALMVVFGLLASGSAARAEAELPYKPVTALTLPADSLPLDQGGTFDFASYKGKAALVVNFWATWCAPCIKELPDLDAAARALAGDDISVVLVSVDRKGAEHAQAFLAKRGVTTALSVHNPMSGWAREMGIRGLPSTFLISRDQTTAYLVQGPAEWAAPEILAEIRDLLATPQ